MLKKRLLTISGPSLAGKSTLGKMLSKYPQFREVVSHTTRAPRRGEVDGKSYYFVSLDEFDSIPMVGQTYIGAYSYGTSIGELKQVTSMEGVTPFMVVDPVGVLFMHRWCQDNGVQLTAIWVDIPREQQILRWMDRVKDDDPGNVKRHLDRLYAIMTTEDEWYAMCRWDYEFPYFAEETEEQVISQIMTLLSLPYPPKFLPVSASGDPEAL